MELLSVKEVAALKGCSVQYIKKLALENILAHEESVSEKGRKKYLFPLGALDAHLQRKWYKQHGAAIPAALREIPKAAPPKEIMPLDSYTLQQRNQIDWWITLLEKWQSFRSAYKGSMSEADGAFHHQERLEVSIKTMYRRLAAYRAEDWDGLVDQRGKANKGRCAIPQEIRELFEYFYLDEHSISVSKCFEATRKFLEQERPELLGGLPSYATAHRWAQAMPGPVSTLAREGDKAFNDKYGVFVDRLYEDMASNDYWIADGHTIDVITKTEDGREKTHRLTLSAFIDARSGIYVGWVLTDNPSSDATLLALRKAIMRYGIPRYLYADNGREYLNHDIGGMGHRARKRQVKLDLPTPILSRLGITMTNALPRNGQAKTIEREFRNFTFLASLFDTYVGSNVVAKPEKLKEKLKNGRIPTDSELYEVVESMIEGYFNCQVYNGKVVSDRGMTRMEVYHAHLFSVRKAAPADLNLMMMRSSRLQSVGRNGVYVTIGGERIYYFDDELLMMQGKKVFVRYDPESMEEVRVYDENEVFLKTAPLPREIMESYFATKEGLREAMAVKRRWHRMAKDEIHIAREKIVSQYGHINALDIFVRAANINRQGLLVPGNSSVVELVRTEETVQRIAATGTDGGVMIDKSRMIQNNERQV